MTIDLLTQLISAVDNYFFQWSCIGCSTRTPLRRPARISPHVRLSSARDSCSAAATTSVSWTACAPRVSSTSSRSARFRTRAPRARRTRKERRLGRRSSRRTDTCISCATWVHSRRHTCCATLSRWSTRRSRSTSASYPSRPCVSVYTRTIPLINF